MTTYPSVGDYTSALQNPAAVFSHPSLRKARFTQGFGGPFCASGTSAVVFQARVDDKLQALRCYLRDDAATPERYAALDQFVAGSRLGQFIGTVTWYREEVRVNGARWPVLEMDWIEGQHLNNYAGFLAEAENTTALGGLAGHWLEMVNGLQGARFAHGDLQHGNVLVDTGRRLRLVDFDSVWLPELHGQAPPAESGHSNFQPPGLTGDGRWGPFMDTFAGLAVYLALIVLTKRPQLWGRFNSGDNILFERADFVPPHDTDVWRSIGALGDSEVDRMADKVKECCAPGWKPDKTLAETLAHKLRWWENGGTAGAPARSPAAGSAPAAPPAVPGATAILPPLPTKSYQSPVASQGGSAKSGAAGRASASQAQPGARPARGKWWEDQPGQAASTPPQGWPAQPPRVTRPTPLSTRATRTSSTRTSRTPSTRTSRTPSTRTSRTPSTRTSKTPSTRTSRTQVQRRRRPGFVVTGLLLMIVGLVTWISLATHHDPSGGAVTGIVFLLIGLLLVRRRR